MKKNEIMDRNRAQEILDNCNIRALDELNILRYIQDLEEVVEEQRANIDDAMRLVDNLLTIYKDYDNQPKSFVMALESIKERLTGEFRMRVLSDDREY